MTSSLQKKLRLELVQFKKNKRINKLGYKSKLTCKSNQLNENQSKTSSKEMTNFLGKDPSINQWEHISRREGIKEDQNHK